MNGSSFSYQMEIGFWEKSGRMFMYIFNGIFLIFAAILFAVCMYVHFDKNLADFIGTLEFEEYYRGAIICACGACLVLTATFAACCGTYFQYSPLLKLYLALTVVSFVLNLCGATYLLLMGLEATYVYSYTGDKMIELMYLYYQNTTARLHVDILQEYLGCCGAYSPTDWTLLHMPVPDTCRNKVTGNQYKASCAEQHARRLEPITGVICGIALWLCFLQLFTLVFSICIYRGVRQRRDVYDKKITQPLQH